MLTVTTLCVLAAFLTTIAAAMGRAPLWIGVLLAVLTLALMVLPR
jgi:hypothetical protein